MHDYHLRTHLRMTKIFFLLLLSSYVGAQPDFQHFSLENTANPTTLNLDVKTPHIYHHDSSGDDLGMSTDENELSINFLHPLKETCNQGCRYSSVDNIGLSSEDNLIDDISSNSLQPMESLYEAVDFFSGDEPGMSTNVTDDDTDNNLISPVQGPMHAAKIPVCSSLDKHITAEAKHSPKMLARACSILDLKRTLKAKCKCKENCVSKFTLKEVKELRLNFWSHPKHTRFFILNNFQNLRKKQGKFTFVRTESGVTVCMRAFLLLYRINKNSLTKANSITGKTVGLPKIKAKSGNTISLIAWFEEYVYFHGDFMPHKQDILLPYGSRKLHVYEQYKLEVTSPVSKSTFFDVWGNHFPHVKVKKTTAFTKCSICGLLERQMQNTLIPEQRAIIRNRRKMHNDRQMKERVYYHRKREQSRVEPKKFLSLIVDGMDQSKTNLPHFKGRLPKSINPVDLLKTHITGVINHGHGGFRSFIDFNQFPHDPNLTITVILKMLMNTAQANEGKLPPVLYLQADNCVRENKNRFVLAFLQLLVEKNIFKQIHLSFLPVGHTHEDIDARFSLIARDLFQMDTENLDDFVNLLGQHEYIKSIFDVREWIQSSIPKYISGTTEPLHYKFEKIDKKVMTFYKGISDDSWKTQLTGFLLDIPKGKPKYVASDFTDFQEERFLKLIETNKALFKSSSILDKWKTSLKEIKKKTEEKWILPDLPRQQERQEMSEVRLADEVESILDKENREPELIVRKGPNQMSRKEKRQSSKRQTARPIKNTNKRQEKRKNRVIITYTKNTIIIWLDTEIKKHIWLNIFMDIYFHFCLSLLALCLFFMKLFSQYLCLFEFLLLINLICYQVVSVHVGNFACVNLSAFISLLFYNSVLNYHAPIVCLHEYR